MFFFLIVGDSIFVPPKKKLMPQAENALRLVSNVLMRKCSYRNLMSAGSTHIIAV